MLEYLKNEANKTYTENGAVSNRSTGKDCLDLFATIGALRQADEAEICTRFLRAYAEDPDLAQDTIQGSAVLHCFDWSYNNIKAKLPEIAAAGYTAVQTSPVQPPKDYQASWTDGVNQWWKLYQPLDLAIAEAGTSWLGSATELT